MSFLDISQILGNLGEFVGSIAVLATLIYLSIQIKHNTEESKAATIQNALDSEMAVSHSLAGNPVVWDKVVTGQPLEEGEETRAAVLLYGLVMMEAEQRFRRFESGRLDAETYHARLRALGPFVRLPVYQLWRQSLGAMNRSASFLELMDGLADGSSGSPQSGG